MTASSSCCHAVGLPVCCPFFPASNLASSSTVTPRPLTCDACVVCRTSFSRLLPLIPRRLTTTVVLAAVLADAAASFPWRLVIRCRRRPSFTPCRVFRLIALLCPHPSPAQFDAPCQSGEERKFAHNAPGTKRKHFISLSLLFLLLLTSRSRSQSHLEVSKFS